MAATNMCSNFGSKWSITSIDHIPKGRSFFDKKTCSKNFEKNQTSNQLKNIILRARVSFLKKKIYKLGIDPATFRMLSERSTI